MLELLVSVGAEALSAGRVDVVDRVVGVLVDEIVDDEVCDDDVVVNAEEEEVGTIELDSDVVVTGGGAGAGDAVVLGEGVAAVGVVCACEDGSTNDWIPSANDCNAGGSDSSPCAAARAITLGNAKRRMVETVCCRQRQIRP